MVRKTDRNVSWIKRARKVFDTFPLDARQTTARALTQIAGGLQFGDDIWVVHAFQKKSKTGTATPKHAIDMVRERIKRLKAALA